MVFYEGRLDLTFVQIQATALLWPHHDESECMQRSWKVSNLLLHLKTHTVTIAYSVIWYETRK